MHFNTMKKKLAVKIFKLNNKIVGPMNSEKTYLKSTIGGVEH